MGQVAFFFKGKYMNAYMVRDGSYISFAYQMVVEAG